MAEKVKVSREVAELATKFDHRHSSIGVIEEIISADGYDESQKTLAINAFLNGYEVEKTPEEILVQVYQESLRIGAGHRVHANAIKFTLDTLGIKIKGINE